MVVDGPTSNVFTLACSESEFSSDLEQSGIYKIRVESRENDELGAYFIIPAEETVTCMSEVVVNATYEWTEDSKLRLQWTENDVIGPAEVEVDSYQIFVRTEGGKVVWAKIIERIELILESDQFLAYRLAGLKENLQNTYSYIANSCNHSIYIIV